MNKFAVEILNKLAKAGFEAYVVGGYVRDFLLTGKTKDIDFCTNATPKEIGALFQILSFSGAKYGTSLILYRGHKYEITTYRKELHYLKHRSPETIEYINNIDDDVIRRDFTINAVCMNAKGEIYDPLNGINDLNQKIIRAIGDADSKINNDSLRILRAIRFATILDFRLDFKLELAIIKYKDNLKHISYEVKKKELDKILASQNKLKGLNLIKKFNLDIPLDIYIPEKTIDTDILGMYAQLKFDKCYPLTKHEKESVNIINNIVNAGVITKIDILNHGIYLVKIAASILNISLELIDQMYSEMPIYAADELHLTGDDIISAIDVPSGPVIKEIKNELINQVVYGNIINHKKVLKNYLIKNKAKWYNEKGD